MTDNLDVFTRAFLECALQSSSDDEDTPLDAQYDIRDFAPETLERLVDECKRFQASPVYQSALEANACLRVSEEWSAEALAGLDFWFSRDGHGTGFWDAGRWEKPHADKLDELSEEFGAVDLYVGDDGKIYA